MKPEEIQLLKKDHDFCIIPAQSVESIEFDVGRNRDVIVLSHPENIIFVNSDYFKVADWGKL